MGLLGAKKNKFRFILEEGYKSSQRKEPKQNTSINR